MMKIQRKPMTRLEVLVLIAIFALTALGGRGGSRFLQQVHWPLPPRPQLDGLPIQNVVAVFECAHGKSRLASGLAAASTRVGSRPLMSSITPGTPTPHCNRSPERWKQAGFKAISRLDPPLQTARDAGDSINTVNYSDLTGHVPS